MFTNSPISIYAVRALILLTVLAVLCMSSGQAQEISDQCIGCICYGGNGCKKDAGCHDGVCGPLLITWGYWADAGKPVIRGMDPSDPMGKDAEIPSFFSN